MVRRADNLRPEGDFQRREEGRWSIYQLSTKKYTQLILPSENYEVGGSGDDGDTTQGVGGRGESGELQEDGQLESSGGIRLRLRNILAAT